VGGPMMAPTTPKIALAMGPASQAWLVAEQLAAPPIPHSMPSCACACHKSAAISHIIGVVKYVARNVIMPAIISMSVGTTRISLPLQLAINNTVALYKTSAGIIASAGNDASDACDVIPGRRAYSSSQKSASKHVHCCTLQHFVAPPTAMVS